MGRDRDELEVLRRSSAHRPHPRPPGRGLREAVQVAILAPLIVTVERDRRTIAVLGPGHPSNGQDAGVEEIAAIIRGNGDRFEAPDQDDATLDQHVLVAPAVALDQEVL